MLAFLSSPVFDQLGYIELDIENNTKFEIARRVGRSATLDGSSAFVDAGFAYSDAKFVLAIRQTSSLQHDAVTRLLRLNTRLILSVPDGVFLAVPESYVPGGGTSTLSLYVDELLSA